MIRFGLCCIFYKEPIKFHTTRAVDIAKLSRRKSLEHIAKLCALNAQSLMRALEFCFNNGIGCFRVNSKILPLKTHPIFGYDLKELPFSKNIIEQFKKCRKYAKSKNLRTTFHPDQFVVLNSPNSEVVKMSLRELEYQKEIAYLIGADVINIHAGGAFGNKEEALSGLSKVVSKLPKDLLSILTLENDDRIYTPLDLLPLCNKLGIPFVYDVHHHRCNSDGMTEEEVTQQALRTWDREPLFHISSPREGWNSKRPQKHHNYVFFRDFPRCWLDLDITVEIEAKFKELAVRRLIK